MLVCEVTDPYLAVDDNFRQQAQAIELIRLRVEQIRALRIKLTELNKVPRSRRNSLVADEMGLTVFKIFRARSELAEFNDMLRALRSQQSEQARARAPALQLAAPTAPERRYGSKPLALAAGKEAIALGGKDKLGFRGRAK